MLGNARGMRCSRRIDIRQTACCPPAYDGWDVAESVPEESSVRLAMLVAKSHKPACR